MIVRMVDFRIPFILNCPNNENCKGDNRFTLVVTVGKKVSPPFLGRILEGPRVPIESMHPQPILYHTPNTDNITTLE
jgi:hypothetical protein